MKSVSLAFLIGIIVSIFSCNSSSSNVSKLANSMCDCFVAAESKLDAETAAVFQKVAESENPQQMLQQEMAKLSPGRTKIITDIISMVSDKDSPISKCLNEFDKKHPESKSLNRKQMALDIIAEMKKNKCTVGTVVMYMGTKNL